MAYLTVSRCRASKEVVSRTFCPFDLSKIAFLPDSVLTPLWRDGRPICTGSGLSVSRGWLFPEGGGVVGDPLGVAACGAAEDLFHLASEGRRLPAAPGVPGQQRLGERLGETVHHAVLGLLDNAIRSNKPLASPN
jgi:hypothetical protein